MASKCSRFRARHQGRRVPEVRVAVEDGARRDDELITVEVAGGAHKFAGELQDIRWSARREVTHHLPEGHPQPSPMLDQAVIFESR